MLVDGWWRWWLLVVAVVVGLAVTDCGVFFFFSLL